MGIKEYSSTFLKRPFPVPNDWENALHAALAGSIYNYYTLFVIEKQVPLSAKSGGYMTAFCGDGGLISAVMSATISEFHFLFSFDPSVQFFADYLNDHDSWVIRSTVTLSSWKNPILLLSN